LKKDVFRESLLSLSSLISKKDMENSMSPSEFLENLKKAECNIALLSKTELLLINSIPAYLEQDKNTRDYLLRRFASKLIFHPLHTILLFDYEPIKCLQWLQIYISVFDNTLRQFIKETVLECLQDKRRIEHPSNELKYIIELIRKHSFQNTTSDNDSNFSVPYFFTGTNQIPSSDKFISSFFIAYGLKKTDSQLLLELIGKIGIKETHNILGVKASKASISDSKKHENLELHQFFKEPSQFRQVIEILADKDFCDRHTYVWKDQSKGNKETFAALMKDLHFKGYLNRDYSKNGVELKEIAQTTFKLSISQTTARKASHDKLDTNLKELIPYASTLPELPKLPLAE
jgi:hypothetical protein